MIRDDRGQMMLLAGVLLVIGFIALAGLVSVAQRLGEQTLQDEGRSALLEMGPVADAVDQIVLDLDDRLTDSLGSAAFMVELEKSLNHLQSLEQRRGFLFDWDSLVACTIGTPWSVSFTLADAETRLALTGMQHDCPV